MRTRGKAAPSLDGTITTRAVSPEDWAILEAFFGPSGAYSNCWCTWFRQSSEEYRKGCSEGGGPNRELLNRLTLEGAAPGLLAYEDDRPVGWVSVAPREEFGRILRSPSLRPPDPAAKSERGVWSVVCFWIPRAERGRGIARSLLAGAVEHARRGGATAIEGYPVDTAGAKKAAASIYTGTVELFTTAGFEVIRSGLRGTSRVVVRRRP
jgi:GNAT superfamily N-acetyltransferase